MCTINKYVDMWLNGTMNQYSYYELRLLRDPGVRSNKSK